MKKHIFSIALILSLAGSLSSCFVNRDHGHHRGPGPERGHDHHDDHRDDHHYNGYNH